MEDDITVTAKKSLLERIGLKRAGRKYTAFLICIILAVSLFVYTGYHPEMKPVLPAILTAIGTYFTIYSGANVAQKKVSIGPATTSQPNKDPGIKTDG